MAEIRVTCPTRQLLITAIPVQFVDGEAIVSEAVAEELRPYAAAHGLEFHTSTEPQPETTPTEEPTEPQAAAPKRRGKRAASPFGN